MTKHGFPWGAYQHLIESALPGRNIKTHCKNYSVFGKKLRSQYSCLVSLELFSQAMRFLLTLLLTWTMFDRHNSSRIIIEEFSGETTRNCEALAILKKQLMKDIPQNEQNFSSASESGLISRLYKELYFYR